eukprot:SAG22_NODE_12388_length_444_cov_1.202899_1_plen_49_part_10
MLCSIICVANFVGCHGILFFKFFRKDKSLVDAYAKGEDEAPSAKGRWKR